MKDVPPVVEAADAGPDNDRSAESRDTTGHVHDARSSEVDHTAVEQEVFLAKGGSPSFAVPGPVHHHGVDEGSQDDRVDDVGVEGHAFGDGSRNDGSRGRSERPLEEPTRVVVALDLTAIHKVVALERVVGGTNELAWSYTRKLALHDPGEKGMSELRAYFQTFCGKGKISFVVTSSRMLCVRVDNLLALGSRARSGHKKDVTVNER